MVVGAIVGFSIAVLSLAAWRFAASGAYRRLRSLCEHWVYRLVRSGEDERRRRVLVDRHGFDIADRPQRELRTLLRSVPVQQTHEFEGGMILVPSVDLYAEGCSVNLRLLLDRALSPDTNSDPTAYPAIPQPVLTAVDEWGRSYAVTKGGGLATGHEARMEFRVEPLPDARVNNLVLVITEIVWEKHDRQHSYPSIERVQAGPWSFAVPLR